MHYVLWFTGAVGGMLGGALIGAWLGRRIGLLGGHHLANHLQAKASRMDDGT